MLTKKPYIVSAGPKLFENYLVKLTVYVDDWMHEVIQEHEAVIHFVTYDPLPVQWYFVDPRYDADEVVRDICKQLDASLALECAIKSMEEEDDANVSSVT